MSVVTDALLTIQGLKVEFPVGSGLFGTWRRQRRDVLHAVDGVDLSVAAGEALGLVGESGCGKTTLGRSIVGLTKPTAGRLLFREEALSLKRTPSQHRAIQMVFQDPYSSLNPRMTVEQTLGELLRVHHMVERSQINDRCAELLEVVGLGGSALDAYPRQLSGGQRQRVAIARAIALNPELLIADEPVSALDVSVQATVLALLQDLQSMLGGMTMLFISHNLAVVRHICSRVAVMYLGRVVEVAPTDALFTEPLHPYTKALLASVPHMRRIRSTSAPAIVGDPPSPVHLPSGCRFHPRCESSQDVCAIEDPLLRTPEGMPGREVACHLAWPLRAAKGEELASARESDGIPGRRSAVGPAGFSSGGAA